MTNTSSSIQPFRIDIYDSVLDDLRDRISQARWPRDLEETAWERGVPVSYLRPLAEYWRDRFDWRAQEAQLNELPHFITDVDGQTIHFVHVRSAVPGARPLLLLHGWPSSFVEFLDVIGPLTDPVAHGGREEDAVHVVIPSLPGFGFSPLAGAGWGDLFRVAGAMVEVMTRLGYDRFLAQGTDVGSGIVGMLPMVAPGRIIATHVNGPSPFPLGPAIPVEGLDEADRERAERFNTFREDGAGYLHIQATRPQTIAYGLNDSPVAQLAWIVEKFKEWSDPTAALPEDAVDIDRLLTTVSLYWFTEGGWSSAHALYEGATPATGRRGTPVVGREATPAAGRPRRCPRLRSRSSPPTSRSAPSSIRHPHSSPGPSTISPATSRRWKHPKSSSRIFAASSASTADHAGAHSQRPGAEQGAALPAVVDRAGCQSVTDAVHLLVGMQGQAPLAPYVGLWTRLGDFAPRALADALEERSLVRATLMRGTVHLVTADDALQLRPLVEPAIARGFKGGFSSQLTHDDERKVVELGRELLAQGPRSRVELRRLFLERWPELDADAMAYAVSYLLPTVQPTPRGVWGQPQGAARLALMDAWIGRPLVPAPSIDDVVLRYIGAFGPASVGDVQAWSGLTGLREVLDRLAPQLRVFTSEHGDALYDLPDAPRPDADIPVPPRFLPEYDNVLFSHRDRRRIIDTSRRVPLPPGNGARAGTFLLDGLFRGTWSRDGDALRITPFTALDDAAAGELVTEGKLLATFLGVARVELLGS
ncbi:DNA glycosylase AlkZ-like family protein [Microbacterium sp. LWH12-1.2]|uniref:DNA glycosylase AlkZ-like family protein n=1 Tax=Microbacterium sp. LWH12-1.2 TaxID=3135259 RepID=UPI0034427069